MDAGTPIAVSRTPLFGGGTDSPLPQPQPLGGGGSVLERDSVFRGAGRADQQSSFAASPTPQRARGSGAVGPGPSDGFGDIPSASLLDFDQGLGDASFATAGVRSTRKADVGKTPSYRDSLSVTATPVRHPR